MSTYNAERAKRLAAWPNLWIPEEGFQRTPSTAERLYNNPILEAAREPVQSLWDLYQKPSRDTAVEAALNWIDPSMFLGAGTIKSALRKAVVPNELPKDPLEWNRALYKGGLHEGDTFWRGVEEGTWDRSKIANAEVGPHGSTLRDVSQRFAENYTGSPKGGLLVESEWTGKGKGYYLGNDLAHSDPPSVIDRILQRGGLPDDLYDDLEDLRDRYQGIFQQLERSNFDRPETGLSIFDKLNQSTSKELSDIMGEAGYDHLTYKNTAASETPGHISVIPLQQFPFKEKLNNYIPPEDVYQEVRKLNDAVEASLITPEEKWRAYITNETIPKDVRASDFYGSNDLAVKTFDLLDPASTQGLLTKATHGEPSYEESKAWFNYQLGKNTWGR